MYLAEPVATGYDKVVPDSWQTGIRNFFRNLRTPVQVISNVLQLKFTDALKDTGRFVVNTTAGGLGFVDVADKCIGWEYKSQDIGTALGYYGIPEGPYIVLPILGPSNLRDTVSNVAEVYLNPLYWLAISNVFDGDTDFYWATAVTTTQFVNTRARYLDIYKDMKENAVDYYLSQQSYYTQYRRGEIEEGQPLDAKKSEGDNWYDDEEDF
jgi:phospholipid-binding lipoprotein MlaA